MTGFTSAGDAAIVRDYMLRAAGLVCTDGSNLSIKDDDADPPTASTQRFVFAVVRAGTSGDPNRMPDSVLAQMNHVRWKTFRTSVPGVDKGYWGHADSFRVAPFVGFGQFSSKPRAREETVDAYKAWLKPAVTALFRTSCSAVDPGYDPRKSTVATTAGYICVGVLQASAS